MNRITLLICTAAIAAAATAQAADTVRRKPGLWEMQSTMSGAATPGRPDMSAALASLPPAQRALVEEKLKQQGVGAAARPNTSRFCLSQSDADRPFQPRTDNNPDSDCTSHVVGNDANTEVRFNFSCKKKDGSTSEGDGRAYDFSPETFAVTMNMKMQRDGKPMDVKMEQKARWLGSDCGGVK